MARIVSARLAAGLILLLAACSPKAPPPAPEQVFEPVSIFSAQSIGPVEGGISALAFAPNATIPWEGRLLVAPKTGGLIAYGIEGKAGNQIEGKTYTSIAAQAGFELRQLKTSFVLAVDASGHLDAMIVDDARGQIFAAPLDGIPLTGVSGVCAMQSLPPAPNFGLTRTDGSFEQWQIKDTGQDQLQAKLISSGKLTIPASNCASANRDMFVSGTDGGVFRVDLQGTPAISSGIDTPISNWVVIAPDEAEYHLLSSQEDKAQLAKYDAKLVRTGSIIAVQSLSMPAISQPGALAISNWSFGGSGFSAGLMAIADDSNGKISLIVLDTLPGFAHHQEDK
jgi:hypothetical protein